MDKQAVFSKAVTGLIKQKALSKIKRDESETFICVYFDAKTGNRCAVGHLVTKGEARTMEDLSGGENAASAVKCLPKFFAKYELNHETESDLEFLNSLQVLHDYSGNISDFIDRAKKFALENELEFPQ